MHKVSCCRKPSNCSGYPETNWLCTQCMHTPTHPASCHTEMMQKHNALLAQGIKNNIPDGYMEIGCTLWRCFKSTSSAFRCLPRQTDITSRCLSIQCCNNSPLREIYVQVYWHQQYMPWMSYMYEHISRTVPLSFAILCISLHYLSLTQSRGAGNTWVIKASV